MRALTTESSSCAQAYTAGEVSMFDMVHQMRSRIIKSPSFTGDKVIGAILFEDTMMREVSVPLKSPICRMVTLASTTHT